MEIAWSGLQRTPYGPREEERRLNSPHVEREE